MTEAAFWQAVAGYLPPGTPAASWPEALVDRPRLALQIFMPRDPDANPYYYSGQRLGQCVAATRAVMALAGPRAVDPAADDRLNRLAEALGLHVQSGDALARLSACPLALARDFAYRVSHHVLWVGCIAGGHRGKIRNDTEIDLTVSLLPGTGQNAFLQELDDVCKQHGVQWRLLG